MKMENKSNMTNTWSAYVAKGNIKTSQESEPDCFNIEIKT